MSEVMFFSFTLLVEAHRCMVSQVSSREKLLQFYLFGVPSQEVVFEALVYAKGAHNTRIIRSSPITICYDFRVQGDLEFHFLLHILMMLPQGDTSHIHQPNHA